MSITGMNMKKRVDLFSLSFYGLVIFPTALGHINEVVSDLFDRLDKRETSTMFLYLGYGELLDMPLYLY
ncbi:hypothetical protein Goklo_021349 [Gossypium klotzschianum]|uniref:Uncharacterized protein n=1 Tax=Gossypium klotzschianum TaxID=34286 RepID=A0A7J8UUZ1_9ROSI|nr:hypothetical protein [Gossypium klotzschianum]